MNHCVLSQVAALSAQLAEAKQEGEMKVSLAQEAAHLKTEMQRQLKVRPPLPLLHLTQRSDARRCRESALSPLYRWTIQFARRYIQSRPQLNLVGTVGQLN